MKGKALTLTTGLMLCMITLPVLGDGHGNMLRVHAPVVEVEPLTEPAVELERCEQHPPDGSLVAALAWDLGEYCTVEVIESATVTGYRVYYRWDDRVHSQVMAERPGKTVPLVVRLD